MNGAQDTPRSAYDTCGGLVYFPRMLNKLRKFAAGHLRADYHGNLGVGLDGFMCRYLHVDYDQLRAQTLAGASDDDVLAWCYQTGRALNETEVYIWNCFARKRGWRDEDSVSAYFQRTLAESGFGHRDDLLTAFDFYEADEGRELSTLARASTWDRVTGGYDAELRPAFEPFSSKALEIAGVKSGSNIIDIAAGPGTLVSLAVAQGATITAVDFSPRMIARLRDNIARNQWSGVTAQTGDGMALAFADGTFDAAFSMFGLMFFSDRAKGFAEMLRVLKPGGCGVISTWVPMTLVPLFSSTMLLLSEALPDLLPSKPLPPILNEPSLCIAEMSAAGFENVKVIEHSTTIHAPTLAAFVDSMLRTNAIVAHLAQTAGERWPQAEKHLREGLAAKFGTGPQSMTMIALITSGNRPL